MTYVDKQKQRQWYIDNAERLKEYRKRYYSKPEVKAKVKKWRDEHRDSILASKKRSHEKHKEADNLRAREYKRNNQDKIREMMREWRANNPGLWKYHHDKNQKKYAARNNIVIKAHNEVAKAIRSGKLEIQCCEVCKNKKAEAHHDNYNRPLEVRWLCKKCHTEWHKYNKPIKVKE